VTSSACSGDGDGDGGRGAGAPLRLSDGSGVRLNRTRRPATPAAQECGEVAADDLCGRPIARGAYRRVYGPRATLELDVEDAYWHGGLPQLVLDSLCADAARSGIWTLLARVGASDVRLLALLREDFAAREVRDGAFVDVELPTAARPRPGGLAQTPAAH
jgi:hypothetical protein